MKIKYFEDTDTALVELSSNEVAEAREINENVLVDLDRHGKVVSLTIEHASEQADMSELAFQRLGTVRS